MKQPIAKSMNAAITMIEQLADGVGTYASVLDLSHNTKTLLLSKRQAAIDARNNYELSKESLRIVRESMEQYRLESRAMIMLGRDILKPTFGNEFNNRWIMLGFDGSLETPESVDALAIQTEAFDTFFTANPAMELPSKNLTAAQAHLLRQALIDGRKAINDKETEMEQTMAIRDAKFDDVRKRIRFTIDELSNLLDPLDPRWKAFGLNIPGAQETPDVPTNVMAVLIGPNAAATKWGASSRADYYRVWMKIHGTTSDYVAVGSPADLDFPLENLPSASTIDIAISALNDGGESALSEAITITTH